MNEDLYELRREVELLREQNARLQLGLDAIERRLESRTADAAATELVAVEPDGEHRIARRRALQVLTGAAAAGAGLVAAGLSSNQPAAAGPMDPLAQGPNVPTVSYVVNASLSTPVLDITNTGNAAALHLGAGTQDALVVDGSSRFADLRAATFTNTGQFSVERGVVGSGTKAGVTGNGVAVGVEGNGLIGVRAATNSVVVGSGIGLEASGDLANAHFIPAGPVPWTRFTGSAPAVFSGGELVVDSTGAWWACVTPGSAPASWRMLASPDSAGSFVAIVPLRFYDSRISGNRLAADTERIVDLPATIPSDVRAVHVNVTVTDTIGSGYLAVFPADTLWPGTSTVNWSGDNQFVANAVNVKVGAHRLTLRSGTNATNIVLDLYGYYR